MAFSKEDRKKVFDFFQKILQKVEQPVYYENLRGHISKADYAVKDYVLKKCKGEELLKYFKNRKNYFTVNFHSEVSLKKKPNLLCTSSLATQNGSKSKKIAEPDDIYCSENSDEFFYDSRSNSMSSIYESASSEDEDHSNEFDDMIGKSLYYKNSTLNYFCDLLRKKKKINLNTIEIKLLPEDVKYYVTKHLKRETILFFKDNPDIFHIDDEDFISLVNMPLSTEGFQKIDSKKDTPSIEIEEKSAVQLEKIQSITDYLQCVEFFAGFLKKRSLPLKNLSGKLSQASPNVLEFLNTNYSTFKHFLIEADKLFIVKDDDISLCKDGLKLIKQARKLQRFNEECPSQSIKNVFHSLFQSEKYTIKNSNTFKEEETSSDSCKLGSPVVDTSARNVSQSSKKEKLNAKVDEKLNASEVLAEELPDKNAVSEEYMSHETPLKKVSKRDVDNPTEILSNEDMVLENSSCDITEEAHENPLQSVDKMKKNTQRTFIECIFTVQLLCLEVHEKRHMLCLKYEHEAVKHFVEVLLKFPERASDLHSLKGSLGQASSEVNFFMKQLYKREKINSFFVDHKEFIINSPCLLVKLSPTYKDCLEAKNNMHEAFVAGEKTYDVHDLYNSSLHEAFADVIDCLSKVCCFLQTKSKTKLSRLNGMLSSKFSASQLDFINLLSGSIIAEKFKKFLHYFTFFNISDEYIEIVQNLDISLFVTGISRFSEKLNIVKKSDKSKLPYFDYLVDNSLTYEDEIFCLSSKDLKNSIIDTVRTYILFKSGLDYSDLPNIVGYEVILTVLLEKKDSRILIQLLEESGLFKLENGQVSLKDSEENKFCENVNESGDIIRLQNLNGKSTVINEDIKSNMPVLNSFCEVLSKSEENKIGTEVCVISNIDRENEELGKKTVCESMSSESDKVMSFPLFNLKDVESYNKREIENDIEGNQKSSKNLSFVKDSENLASQTLPDINKNSECTMFKKHNKTMSDKLLTKSFLLDAGSGNLVSNSTSSPLSVLVKPNCENEVKVEQKIQNDFNEGNIILKPCSANMLKNTYDVEIGETLSVCSFNMDKVKQIPDVTEENVALSTLGRSISEKSNSQDLEYESNVFEINKPKQHKIKSSCNEFEKTLFISSENQHTDKQDVSSFKNDFKSHQYEDGYRDKEYTVENVISSYSEDKESKDADFDRTIYNESVDNCRSPKDAKELIKDSVYHETIFKEDVVGSSFDKNINLLVDETSNATNNKMSICPEKVINVTEDCDLTKSGSKECNSKADQNEVSKSDDKDSSLHNRNVSGSSTSRKNSVIEENLSGINISALFLQPLMAKVILLTIDSCIVETIVSGCKKYVFCLKSSFHCDKHANCSDCFDALTVGDEVSCYIPPAEKFQCGNMCFSFMFCKDSKLENTESMQFKDLFKPQPYVEEKSNERYNHTLTNNECYKHLDSTYIKSEVLKCHNDSISEVKPCSLGIKEKHKRYSMVSQHTQTLNSLQNVYFGVEKGCQVKHATVSQDTQTVCRTSNNECQTDVVVKACPLVFDKASLTECPVLSCCTQTCCLTVSTESQTDFNIKLCPPVCDKSSTTSYFTMSASIQTVSKLSENECQTDISGSIKSCFNACDVFCQTELSGHVQEHYSRRDEYCQTLLLTSETNSAVAESDAESESHFVYEPSTASHEAEVDSFPSQYRSPQKESCSTACQTISTGDIWIKKYML